jgi:hypothetical protein
MRRTYACPPPDPALGGVDKSGVLVLNCVCKGKDCMSAWEGLRAHEVLRAHQPPRRIHARMQSNLWRCVGLGARVCADAGACWLHAGVCVRACEGGRITSVSVKAHTSGAWPAVRAWRARASTHHHRVGLSRLLHHHHHHHHHHPHHHLSLCLVFFSIRGRVDGRGSGGGHGATSDRAESEFRLLFPFL